MAATIESKSLSSVLAAARAKGGSSTTLQLVTFGIGHEEFGVDILAVQEINRMMELTRVPQAPDEVEGVINLRGKIIPVVELRRRFHLEASDRTEQSRIIVVEVHGKQIGFIVDRVNEVRRVESTVVDAAPPMVCSFDADFIAGVAKLENRLLILLDLHKLFDVSSAGQLAAAA
jgi:purine-binding chemotaxis protein CheW